MFITPAKSGLVRKKPITDIPRPRPPIMISTVDAARRISSYFLAPKSWEIRTAQPLPMPMQTARSPMVRLAQPPTAASASCETKLPTTIPSTVL